MVKIDRKQSSCPLSLTFCLSDQTHSLCFRYFAASRYTAQCSDPPPAALCKSICIVPLPLQQVHWAVLTFSFVFFSSSLFSDFLRKMRSSALEGGCAHAASILLNDPAGVPVNLMKRAVCEGCRCVQCDELNSLGENRYPDLFSRALDYVYGGARALESFCQQQFGALFEHPRATLDHIPSNSRQQLPPRQERSTVPSAMAPGNIRPMTRGGCNLDLPIIRTLAAQGIDPDRDILHNSQLLRWSDVCSVVSAWNKIYPQKAFLAQEDENDNLLTLAAFFGNAKHESAAYTACKERVQPCRASICSGGRASDYQDARWGTCYQVPRKRGGSFSKSGSLPANACSSSPMCTDWDGRALQGADCWFGRGALQLTWNCNYAKANALIKELPGFSIDVCRDPDSICTDGKTYFATSLAYWALSVADVFKRDHRMATAMHCIKDGCRLPYRGEWRGSGAADRMAEYTRLMALLGARGN